MAHRALSRLCQHSRCIQQRSLAVGITMATLILFVYCTLADSLMLMQSQLQVGASSLDAQCAAGISCCR